MDSRPIIQRPRSFFGTLALGASAIVIVLTVSCAGIIVYAMNITDRKTGAFLGMVEQAVRGLPELRESLPPILADILNDRRRPAYLSQIRLVPRLAREDDGTYRPLIEVENRGEEVVTALAMRLVVLDAEGMPVESWHDWGATPIMTDDPTWRGPLLPGARRHVVAPRRVHVRGLPADAVGLEVEVTDIRVWEDPQRKLTKAEF